jgi:hypothetical protein
MCFKKIDFSKYLIAKGHESSECPFEIILQQQITVKLNLSFLQKAFVF